MTVTVPRPDDWRRFAARRYRPFHAISTGQALVTAFAADALFIPFLLALGAPAWLATIAGALPMAGSVASAANPAILRRIGGNLRRLTLALAVFETRGFAYALVALGVASGVVPDGVAIGLVVAIVGVGQTAALLSSGNIALWTAIVLTDEERRLVAPRSGVLLTLLSTALLLPISLFLDAGLHLAGVWTYVGLFAVGGLGGLLVPLSARRLPRPGRVSVGAGASAAAEIPPAFERFRRVCALAAVGQGLIPYTAVYAITVLRLSPGFAVMLSAAASLASLVAAVVVGSFLARGSASRVLRASFLVRALAAVLAAGAVAAGPLGPALILVAAVIFNAGGSAGQLAQNERVFRLLSGPARVVGQGRFIAATAGAVTTGAVAQAIVLAMAGPALGPAFAVLYGAAGFLRLGAAARTEVSPGWRAPLAPRPAPATSPSAGSVASVGSIELRA